MAKGINGIYLILLISVISLVSCRQTGKSSKNDIEQPQAYALTSQNSTEKPSINRKDIFKKLAKHWISVKEEVDGKEDQAPGNFELILNADSTFKSWYKSGNNRKQGHWHLTNDSTFSLYLKAIDDYRIIALTDSTLGVKLLWIREPTILYFKEKQ